MTAAGRQTYLKNHRRGTTVRDAFETPPGNIPDDWTVCQDSVATCNVAAMRGRACSGPRSRNQR